MYKLPLPPFNRSRGDFGKTKFLFHEEILSWQRKPGLPFFATARDRQTLASYQNIRKMQPEIKIEVLDIDEQDSDFTKFRMHFANGNIITSFEFYNYLDCFDEFSEKLQTFPVNSKYTIEFQVGEDSEKWAYYMSLVINCEPNGSSIIHVKLDNHEKDSDLVRSEFYIKTVPASLNKFGQILKSWRPKQQKEVLWISDEYDL